MVDDMDVIRTFGLILLLVFLGGFYSVFKGPKKEKAIYLLSLTFGFLVGILLENSLFMADPKQKSLVYNLNPDQHLLALLIVLNLPPILVLGQSILMNKRFPEDWKQVRIRAISISSIILGYCIGILLLYSIKVRELTMGYEFIFAALYYIPLLLVFSFLTFSRGLFIYAGILTIIATYYSVNKLENKWWMTLPILLMVGATGFPLFMLFVYSS
jgi:hypothetical protein